MLPLQHAEEQRPLDQIAEEAAKTGGRGAARFLRNYNRGRR